VFTLPGGTRADIASARLFVDGQEQSPDATSQASDPQAKSNLRLGYYRYNGIQYSIPGLMDEARVGDYSRFSSEAEAAAWFKFTWANVANTGNEVTWGSEQTTGVAQASVASRSRYEALIEARLRHIALVRAGSGL